MPISCAYAYAYVVVISREDNIRKTSVFVLMLHAYALVKTLRFLLIEGQKYKCPSSRLDVPSSPVPSRLITYP